MFVIVHCVQGFTAICRRIVRSQTDPFLSSFTSSVHPPVHRFFLSLLVRVFNYLSSLILSVDVTYLPNLGGTGCPQITAW